MSRRQQTRPRGVAGIGDDSTSTPTHRRSSQIRQATGDPTLQSRRLDSTRRGDDVAPAAAIINALVFLTILLHEYSFWQLLWVVLLGFWRLLSVALVGFWQLLWWVVLVGFWRLLWRVVLLSFWLLLRVALPAVTILGLIVLGMYVVDWVRDRSEVPPPPYPSNDMPVGDNAPMTTGRGGDERTDSAILRERLANLGRAKEYSYEDLSRATESFASDLILGEGGFGIVYKGYIGDDRKPVAVKKIRYGSRQRIEEYISEVESLSQLAHMNVMQLIGYCHESNELILVYEFIGGGSLDHHLFIGGAPLTWERRYGIARGLGSALLYLHTGFHKCVIHRDIKSSNIMLDENFVAKLGDFGLAKLVDHSRDLITTDLKGTRGYLDPEYIKTGRVSKKSDIYSFGVLLLELVCGRRVFDPELARQGLGLVQWVWKRCGYGSWWGRWFRNFHLPVDKRLKDFDGKQAEALIILGMLCAHPIDCSRPSIEEVMAVLNLTAEPPKLPSKMPSFNI